MLELIKEFLWPKIKIILIIILIFVSIYFYIDFRKDTWKKYNDKINYQKNFEKNAITQINNIEQDKNILGDNNAKLVIIEYINVTCPYSLRFHKLYYKRILKDFVKTNKAKYVIRVALASSQSKLMSRIFNCIENTDLAYDFLNNCMLYNYEWVNLNSNKQKEALRKIANFVGINNDEFEKCYNVTNLDSILQSKEQEEMKYFAYISTPMIIVNQKILSGNITYNQLQKIINKEYKKIK